MRAQMGHTRGAGRRTRRASSSTTRAAATAPRRCASSAKAWPTSPPSTASCKRPGRLQARPLRVDGPHGARCLPSGDGVDLPPVLRGAALPAQRDHGAAAGRRRRSAARPAKASTAMSTARRRSPPEPPAPQVDELPPVWVSPRAARRLRAATSCSRTLGAKIETGAIALARRADPGRAAGLRRHDRGRGRAARPDAHRRHRHADRRRRDEAPRPRHQSRDARATCATPPMRCSRATARPVSVIRDSAASSRSACVGHHRQHRRRHLPAAHLQPATTWRPPCTLGLGYPRGPLAMGNLYGPDQCAGGAVQHADRVRRPALPPQPLAAPARRASACR